MRLTPLGADIRSTITNVLRALSNRLRFEDNVDCSIVDVADSGTANTEFTVTHNLGRIPTKYIVVRQDKAGSVYDSSTGSWTSTTMKLKCSAANAVLQLIVL